jgi:hypothetical protein
MSVSTIGLLYWSVFELPDLLQIPEGKLRISSYYSGLGSAHLVRLVPDRLLLLTLRVMMDDLIILQRLMGQCLVGRSVPLRLLKANTLVPHSRSSYRVGSVGSLDCSPGS